MPCSFYLMMEAKPTIDVTVSSLRLTDLYEANADDSFFSLE